MKSLIFVGLFFGGMSSLCPSSWAAGTVGPDKKVEAEVEPILENKLPAQHDNKAATVFWRSLEKAMGDQSSTGDESLVVLLSFSIGESTGEDLLHEVTVRGKRMLPLLMRYKGKTVVFEDGKGFDELRLPAQTREENYTTAISFIKAGRVWGSD
ncbi:MAG: hypothetical protein ACLQMT_12235 [Candidatus Acidiferrales bacterium]